MALFGAHVSAAGSILKTFERAREIGAETFQFFLRSPRIWKWKEPDDFVIRNFSQRLKEFGGPVVVHAPYLVNPASGEPELWRRSVNTIIEELSFCDETGIQYYNLHPGTAKGISLTRAIGNIVKAIEEAILRVNPRNTILLLENTAGERGDVGKKIGEIGEIFKRLKGAPVGICLDTCHLLAGGYKINERDGFNELIEELEANGGIEKVKVIHANDSKVPLGGRRDRHEHIGEGFVGFQGFKNFLSHPYLGSLPYIIETPKEGEMDLVNLKRLREIKTSCGV
jgi:deoxyribonuclease-4